MFVFRAGLRAGAGVKSKDYKLGKNYGQKLLSVLVVSHCRFGDWLCGLSAYFKETMTLIFYLLLVWLWHVPFSWLAVVIALLFSISSE